MQCICANYRYILVTRADDALIGAIGKKSYRMVLCNAFVLSVDIQVTWFCWINKLQNGLVQYIFAKFSYTGHKGRDAVIFAVGKISYSLVLYSV